MKNSIVALAGNESITDLIMAASLTPPSGVTIATITAAGKPIRWKIGGQIPTADDGTLLYPGDPLQYEGDISLIKFIATETGSSIKIVYYR